MSAILGLKLALVPLLIWGITVAGRRFGPAVAGWLAAFPVVSAPVLFFVALEQGPLFAAKAAEATLSAVLAIVVFGLAYAWAATRLAWWGCALVSFACYFTAVTALNLWAPSLSTAALCVSAMLLAAPYLYPRPQGFTAAHPHTPPPRSGPGRDILWRMAAAAALVLGVTHFSSALGPRLSGLLAMFPVMASVLAIFSHRLSGRHFTLELLRGTVMGYYAFACFCLVLALTLPVWGIAAAFGLSLGCAVIVQGGPKLYLRQVRERASPSEV